jgi:hypothetical protein
MQKKSVSKYTAQQLFALGQRILSDRDLSNRFYLGNEIRHLAFNSQRGLAEESEKFLRQRFGLTVDQIYAECDRIEARRKLPAVAEQPAGTAVNIIDLKHGKPEPPAGNTLYRVGCVTCGAPLSVTAVELAQFGNSAFCPQCTQSEVDRRAAKYRAFGEFLEQTPDFYLHQSNIEKMNEEAERLKLPVVTVAHWKEIYASLHDQLFHKLSVKQMQAMTSEQIKARELAGDPELGGAIALLNASYQPPVTEVWSSNEQRFAQSFAGRGRASGSGEKR